MIGGYETTITGACPVRPNKGERLYYIAENTICQYLVAEKYFWTQYIVVVLCLLPSADLCKIRAGFQ